MSWGTKEQKGELMNKGLEGALSLFSAIASESKSKRDNAIADGQISKEEYDELYENFSEYKTRINNLLYDTELGCKLKSTEDIFLMIIEIIMFDLEYDYPEVIQNFTKIIDTEELVRGHELALKKRDERLEMEYQNELEVYNSEMLEYNNKIKEKKSKNFFARLVSEEIIAPTKPNKRT